MQPRRISSDSDHSPWPVNITPPDFYIFISASWIFTSICLETLRNPQLVLWFHAPPPSSRSPYVLYLCVHTVLATCWFSGEQLSHSWESLQ